MCNIMNGLVPVSSLLLIRLFPCCITSGSACVTGIVAANISWGRRWHCCVAATTRLWRSRFTISRSESPPLPTRCGVRFSLLLLPLPPSVCPLDDSPRLAASSVHLYCSLRAALPVRVGFHALAFGSSSLSFSLIINFLSVWPKDMRGRPMTRDDGHHDVSSILGRRSLSILVIWPAHRRNRLSR